MTYFQIPARNDLPFYKFRISLSSTVYSFSFRYNGRMQRWMLDINDASGNQILSGIPVLILRNLVSQYRTLAVPVGLLFATDDTGTDTQPTVYSFGLTNSFWYADPTS
jgi:hypothetical protein